MGRLSTTDPDDGDVHTYTVDDERFEVVYDNLLRLKGENYIPFGSVGTITLHVTSTDALGASITKAFTIDVARPKNQPPKKITLSNNTLTGGKPGEIVGQLTTIDLNVGDTHTYTVSDSRFEVSSDGMLKLKEGVSVDAASESRIYLQVRATDSGGWVYTENFTLQVQAGTGSNGTENNGTGNNGTGNNGTGNNGTATPSELTPGGSDNSRSSGGSGSRSSFRGRRSFDFENASNPYSYIQTNGRIYNHGSWKQEGSVWQLDVDGSLAKSAWAYLSENWYLFNEKGEMMTGWANVDGRWYFMDSSGAVRYNWISDGNGEWYYMNPVSDGTRGAMLIGWQQIDGKWYYFHTASDGTQGMMLKSQRSPDGYLLNADGSWDQSAAKL